MEKTGFDIKKYISMQSESIEKRIEQFGGKLYLEFGGKLFDDFHASRVLPGFAPDTKMRMLLNFADKAEVVIVINSSDIENSKIRGDLGITYDTDVLRLIDAFRDSGFYVGGIVISKYNDQSACRLFKERLENLGLRVYRHYKIDGYPANVPYVVSSEGYGKNEYIETTKPLVIVTAPGPGSGKMATCLSQLYHDSLREIRSGYAKFETFPVWNLPLKHPLNLAYEAATSDLNDVNMIDPFHLEAYGTTAVNYNRDIEIFPVLQALFKKITGECPYKSPTDMGVNMAGNCITDNDLVCEASKQEIIRRYYRAVCAHKNGKLSENSVYKNEMLMKQAGVDETNRPVVGAALQRKAETGAPAAAIQLEDGRMVTGKTSSLLGPAAAVLLNSLKVLGEIHHDKLLISPTIIEPIQKLKTASLGNSNPRLHTDEVLIALAISAASDPTAKLALEQLPNLRNAEMHSSVMLANVDESTLKKLHINLTSEPITIEKRLFRK